MLCVVSSDIAGLFVQLCYCQFNKKEIESNYELNELFDSKPGNVERVAAFYQFLCRTEEEETIINLEMIVNKLKTKQYMGWINEFNNTQLGQLNTLNETLNENTFAIDKSGTDESWNTPAIPEYDAFIHNKYIRDLWGGIADKFDTKYANINDMTIVNNKYLFSVSFYF